MTTRFVRVSWGLEYTVAFLKIGRIKSYIQSFQHDREVDQNTKIYEEIALSAQDRMEEEINQTIRTCDDLAKEELFEYLTGWIQYFENHLSNTQEIENLIDDYNEKKEIEYKKIVELEEEKFRQTKQYNTLKHLDYYEEEYKWQYGMGVIQRFKVPSNRLIQYRKFFEAPDPDLIDSSFLPKYMDIIRPIISRCVKIAKKRLRHLKGENELKKLPPSLTKQTAITTAQSSGDIREINISQIKNNFDFVDINEVYQHFKVGLVDKKYLSEQELLKYLIAAFDKKRPPKKLFILSDVNNKQKIKKIFNVYYKTIAGKPHGKQKEYAALLGNYFRGYNTENVSTNFSK